MSAQPFKAMSLSGSYSRKAVIAQNYSVVRHARCEILSLLFDFNLTMAYLMASFDYKANFYFAYVFQHNLRWLIFLFYAISPADATKSSFHVLSYQGLEYEISCVKCKPRTAVFVLGSILKVIPSLGSPHRQYAMNSEKEQFGNIMNAWENPFDAQKVPHNLKMVYKNFVNHVNLHVNHMNLPTNDGTQEQNGCYKASESLGPPNVPVSQPEVPSVQPMSLLCDVILQGPLARAWSYAFSVACLREFYSKTAMSASRVALNAICDTSPMSPLLLRGDSPMGSSFPCAHKKLDNLHIL